jgi:hypothetical protein
VKLEPLVLKEILVLPEQLETLDLRDQLVILVRQDLKEE